MWLLLLNLIALCSLATSDHHIDCGLPVNIKHGHFHWLTHEGEHTVSTVIRYDCDKPEYTLHGEDNGIYICDSTGKWLNRGLKEVLPTCHRVSCGAPKSIEHGHVDHLTDHTENDYLSVIKYTCDKDYREEIYSDEGIYVCAHNGHWINKDLGDHLPKCIPVHCGQALGHLDTHHHSDHTELVTKGSAPWSVLLKNGTGGLHNGVLVDHHWVLTSSHNFASHDSDAAAHEFTVYVGVEDSADLEAGHPYHVAAVSFEVSDVPVAAEYGNDIALLRLTEEVAYGDHAIPICLPPEDYAHEGLEGAVAGWDLDHATVPHHLTYAAVSVVAKDGCASHFTTQHPGLFPADFHDEFCTHAVEHRLRASERDRGAVFQTEVNGTAYAVGVLAYDDPGEGHDYAVYTDVYDHLDWINQVIKGN